MSDYKDNMPPTNAKASPVQMPPVLWILALLTIVAAEEPTGAHRVVETTRQFRDALYSPSVSNIAIKEDLFVTAEDWGLVRPDVRRQVTVVPHEGVNKTITLDFHGYSDLAFVSPPAGRLDFYNFRIHGVVNFDRASASVVMLTMFRVRPPQSIHLHNCTECWSESVCESFQNNILLGIRTVEFFVSQVQGYYCPSQCKRNRTTDVNTAVKETTADSREVMAILTGFMTKSQTVELVLADDVKIQPSLLTSRTYSGFNHFGSRLVIDGLLEKGKRASLTLETREVVFQATSSFTVDLRNLELVMDWLGDGFFSKCEWGFVVCDDEDYIYKWPLFLPYSFCLFDSVLRMANTTMIYKECPSNLDVDQFMASLKSFNETMKNKDYGEQYVSEPMVDAERQAELSIKFNTLRLDLAGLQLKDNSWSSRAITIVELENVTFTCEASGRSIPETPRCFRDRLGEAPTVTHPPQLTSKNGEAHGLHARYNSMFGVSLFVALVTLPMLSSGLL
ncbi:hypothetical protein BSKO_13608 [Bryopsis sp. KO-2023]|nr:hypothetical protein BSKO_13608 [Bryopsis sp. KO-2023]